MEGKQVVVVFDFDRTMIECDSDNWVVEHCGAAALFRRLRPSLPWNSLMDRMMRELHEQGKSIDEIKNCLKKIPVDPHIVSAIESAHALGCDLRVVSDANLFFIETVLDHHGITECFTEINTNPSFVNEEGRVKILPFHDFHSPHGCNLCPPNMCKGKIIERIQSNDFTEGKGKKIFIYIGDGSGDYCPCLKLSKSDYIMPRENYPLSRLITENAHLIEAEVHQWSNGEELERIVLELIGKSINGNAGRVLSVDCKFGTGPVSAEGGRAVAVRVPQ